MNFRKKPLLARREISLLVLIGLVSVIVVSVLIGVNLGLSRIVPGGGGFYVVWEGARSFLMSHTDPYRVSIASQTQELVYGRAAQQGENPYFLTVPFFLLPIYFPLALISDPAIARGIWMLLCEAMLVATAIIGLRLIEWQPRRFFFMSFILLSIFTFYSVDSLLEGSPTILLGLLFIGILSAYSTGQDELVGALLVFSLFYWEVSFPFVLLTFWRVFLDKRSRVLNGFGMLLAILMILSF